MNVCSKRGNVPDPDVLWIPARILWSDRLNTLPCGQWIRHCQTPVHQHQAMLLRMYPYIARQDRAVKDSVLMRKSQNNQQPAPHPRHIFWIDPARIGCMDILQGIPAVVSFEDDSLPICPCAFINKSIDQVREISRKSFYIFPS